MSAQLAELLKRLLPSESDKRIRRAIMTAFGSASGVARNVRNQIDIENRTRTGVLINGSVVFNSGIEAEVSGWAWVIDFNISQGADQTLVTVAPDANFVRADFFHADSLGVIYYTPGILDTDGNSLYPDIPEDHLVLTKVFRNPNGTNEPADPSEPESILDFTEDNVLPMTFGNKLIRSGAKRNIDRFTFDARVKGEPAILPDEFVTFSQLPTPVRYGLLNGGSIQWSGTGLIYHVAPAVYAIGTQYSAPFAIITLNAADPLLPRLDIIGWNTSGEVIYLPGTPAENPVKPQINPETQLEGTLILVPAGALVPEGIVTEVVYDENIEWVASSTGSGTANFASTSNPKEGTLAIEATNVSSGFTIVLTRATVIDLMTFDTLGLWIKLKGSMHSGYGFSYSFRNAVGDLVSNLNTFELDRTNLDYQFVAIPITDVLLLDPEVKSVHISFVRAQGPAVFSGFFIDLIALQGGAEQPVVVSGINHAPADDQWYASRNGAWEAFVPFSLDASIVDSLNASLADSPSSLNRYVTVNLLNSYSYVQEAPINGALYARKDGAWTSITPFTVAGTPAEGNVVTYVSGVPTWSAPSGGGGASIWTEGTNGLYAGTWKYTLNRLFVNAETHPESAGSDRNPTFYVKAHTDSSLIAFFNIRFSDDTEAMRITGNKVFTLGAESNHIWIGGDPVTISKGANAGVTFKGRSTTNNGFVFLNSAETQLLRITNAGQLIIGSGGGGGLVHVNSPTSPGSWAFVYRGGQSNTNEIFRIQNSSNTNIFQILGNGSVRIYTLPTSDPLVVGGLWNDSGTVKISAG